MTPVRPVAPRRNTDTEVEDLPEVERRPGEGGKGTEEEEEEAISLLFEYAMNNPILSMNEATNK